MVSDNSLSTGQPGTQPPARANTLILLSRHQRALSSAGGIITTLILGTVTAVVIHSKTRDYIAEGHANRTSPRAELFLRGQQPNARKIARLPISRLSVGAPADKRGRFEKKDVRSFATDPISAANDGWQLIHTFPWRTIITALRPTLLAYVAPMLLAIGCVWAVLLLIE